MDSTSAQQYEWPHASHVVHPLAKYFGHLIGQTLSHDVADAIIFIVQIVHTVHYNQLQS